MFLLASKRDRMYTACPLHRFRWTAQSSASFSDLRYRDLYCVSTFLLRDTWPALVPHSLRGRVDCGHDDGLK